MSSILPNKKPIVPKYLTLKGIDHLFDEEGNFYVPEWDVWLNYEEQRKIYELFKVLLDIHLDQKREKEEELERRKQKNEKASLDTQT